VTKAKHYATCVNLHQLFTFHLYSLFSRMME